MSIIDPDCMVCRGHEIEEQRLQAEIQRLRGLVRVGYYEGVRDGVKRFAYKSNPKNSSIQEVYERSDIKQELEDDDDA